MILAVPLRALMARVAGGLGHGRWRGQWGRRLGRVVTSLVALCLFGVLPAQAQQARPIKIASWNIEHLSEKDGEGCRIRSEVDYQDVRDVIARIDADVIAFQEVENQAAAERVFPADQWSVVISHQPYPKKRERCREASGQRLNPQRTGVAIRKGLAFQINPELEGLGVMDDGRSLRWGVDVTLEGPRPLRLLSVHLKSGCASGMDPSNKACAVLKAQVPALEAWIDARQRDGEAFIVAGDWNLHLDPLDPIWRDLDDHDPRGLTLVSVAQSSRPAATPHCDPRYSRFIDHLVMNGRAYARLVEGSFAEISVPSTLFRRASDHCPIVAAFQP